MAEIQLLYLLGFRRLIQNVGGRSRITCKRLNECIGLNSHRLCIIANHRLQTLSVLDCPQLISLHLSANNLKLFRYRGHYPMLWIAYAPSLTDVMLDVRNGPGSFPLSLDNFLELRDAIQNVEILTLCGWFFKVCSPWWLLPAEETPSHSVPQFNNLKELWLIDNSMNIFKMDAMVSFLKICPNLERIFINIDPTCYCFRNELYGWRTVGFEDYVKRTTPNETLVRLKIIKMAGFIDQEEEISLIDRLLKDVAGVEPPMIIATSPENGTRRLIKIPQNQPKLQETGDRKQAAIGNQETEYGYEFVEEESFVLRPKHADFCL
ncbi:hypothetical protein BVC80_1835g711 [Macleaya cordata]|uniref:At1g61320/AtMIF1 LRR domain-containing protein n=1 Tax=Macleaya cordata TaxID=56857 RepID=A0A200R6H6_MACCD|nr:hypothetical protein BVC80_1835g711 [Macleaya cordata]